MIDDTIKMDTKKRNFTGHLPILETIGIANYDEVPSLDKLVFKMREALQKFQKLY